MPRPDEPAWPTNMSSLSRRIVRGGRAVRRALFVLVWTLVCLVVQAAMLCLPGRGKVMFPRIYWSGICRILGMKIRVIGTAARGPASGASAARPIVFISNHSSWLDIAVLGARIDTCFIGKEEISRWVGINLVARVGRTVFVRRRRGSTGRERDVMRDRLAAGDNLVLFPEGTTSDGSRVLPFRSAFFSIAEQPVGADGRPPIVQPISMAFDRLGYLPTGRASRPLFSWYGDMNIARHFWRLAQHRGLRATVLLHAPIDPRSYPSRKALALAVWTTVADGASTLRQNRPARPIAAAAGSRGDEAARPAYI